ncbi:MAG: XTP/dITP diphosphatase [Spirochaetes bacterium]|nr:XTP/dITP diphosphatase [Spirochaetota bacterium]
MKLVIATKNNNKVKEIREKFSDFMDLEIVSLLDFNNLPEVVEDGLTFEENALKKAREYCAFTGLTVLSDDSGIEIDALSGQPGVRSARYAGENASDDENNELVLAKLKKVPDEKRTARFICVIAVVQPVNIEYLTRGICEGRIIRDKSGTNGFGYDPIFFIPHLGKTMAELTLTEKNKISHRALALDKAEEILKKILETS